MTLRAFASPAFARSEDGTSATEFCLIAPLLLVLAGGIVEFGRGFEVSNEVNRLATQYAIAFADCSDIPVGVCGTELASYAATPAVANVSPQVKAASFTLKMFQVKRTGSALAIRYSTPSGSTLSGEQTTAALAVIPDGQSGVVVSVTYGHQIELMGGLVRQFLGPSIEMPYTVVQLKS